MGLGMSTPPFIKVEWVSLSVEEKFAILQQAFEGCKINLPMPENPKEYSKSILKELGFNSWTKFYKDGHHCGIELNIDKKQYQLTPLIYLKENEALYGIKKGIVTLSSETTSEEIITALEKVLARIPELTEDYYANEDVPEEGV